MQSFTPRDAIARLSMLSTAPVRRDVIAEIYGRLKILLDRSRRTRLLTLLQYVVCLVFLVNAGSWPFMWHIRAFRPIIALRLRYWALQCRLLFASEKVRARARIAWLESLSPMGANPFEIDAVYRRWATIDDIDVFGMHLSNSSYAKAFDNARGKAMMKWFPAWVRSGGLMPLSATHYHFLREIAPFARYEVRLTIGAWDHKWLYVVARYVTRPTRGQADASYITSPSTPNTPNAPNTTLGTVQGGAPDVERAVAAIIHPSANASPRATPPVVEPDGALLHCVAVAQVCFKQGRITVPPAVVIASEGLTKPYGDGDDDDDDDDDGAGKSLNSAIMMKLRTGPRTARPYTNAHTHADPPPNWVQSQSLRVPPQGSIHAFRAFLRGGWRDVPAGERWWEDALGGSVEARRRANLEVLESLRMGLEQTRTRTGVRA